jgi:hypothetical protein
VLCIRYKYNLLVDTMYIFILYILYQRLRGEYCVLTALTGSDETGNCKFTILRYTL